MTEQANDNTRFAPDKPDHDNPWAMQLVIHRNKQDPSNHVDVCEAAATAVVTLLDDDRAKASDGEWAEQVAWWRSGWIRKVTRRAENKRWDDAQAIPGVTVVSGDAEVRAIVPGPLTPLPPELKKLQVGGTQFPHIRPSQNDDAVVTIFLTPLQELTTGKAAAQAGHAAQLAYEQMDDAHRATWRADGFRVRVVEPDEASWLSMAAPVNVIDAGLTEVDGPTETARAHW